MRNGTELNRDERFQLGAARLGRRLGRRRFLEKASGVAVAVAGIVVGPAAGKAFAHGTCNPPYGHYCSGCGADSTCPSGYRNCTPSTQCSDTCPYTSAWWYTGTSPNRHKCRDCVWNIVGPIACNQTRYLCGCKSTTHY